jgi:hypothetical protein
VRDKVSFAPLVRLISAGNEVDANPAAAGEVVEGRGHAREQHGLYESGSMRDHHLEVLGAVQHRRGDRPTFWSDRSVTNEYSVESSVIVRSRDRFEIPRFDDGTIHPVHDRTVD